MQLKKKEQMEMFQKEIEKKIEIGTLVAMSDAEVKETMKSTHHFTLLAMVMSETSSSTSARLINNTKTQVSGQGTSYCLENEMTKCNIGDSFDSLLDFRLYNNPYSSDISKCYLRILVDDLTARLRLLVWFEDPQKMTGVKIFRRPTMDFGDTCSSLVVRIVQENFATLQARTDKASYLKLCLCR